MCPCITPFQQHRVLFPENCITARGGMLVSSTFSAFRQSISIWKTFPSSLTKPQVSFVPLAGPLPDPDCVLVYGVTQKDGQYSLCTCGLSMAYFRCQPSFHQTSVQMLKKVDRISPMETFPLETFKDISFSMLTKKLRHCFFNLKLLKFESQVMSLN